MNDLPLSAEPQYPPELRLELASPHMRTLGAVIRAAARMRIVGRGAGGVLVEGPWIDFEAPLTPSDLGELKWYLESNPSWPEELFAARAAKVEAEIPRWSKSLFDASLGRQEQAEVFASLCVAAMADPTHGFLISIVVDEAGPLEGHVERASAASVLWSLPWEILADESGCLSQNSIRAVIRRTLPDAAPPIAREAKPSFRVLLVIARPEQEGVPFMDPRVSALPLSRALAPLGSKLELTTLAVGSFEAMEEALEAAEAEGRPYSVVHFDGHGAYDAREQRGVLYFEGPQIFEEDTFRWPGVDPIDARYFGSRLSQHRIELVFLEACQSAASQGSITASVAARLHEAGGTTVVAMGHAVRVEASGRFVDAFYQAIVAGESVGGAMLRGRRALASKAVERSMLGLERRMRDWLLPVLFQCGVDCPVLRDFKVVRPVPPWFYRDRLGLLPAVPPENLLGHSRALVTLERLFQRHRMLAVLGAAGIGKTMIAVSLAHWLIGIGRFDRIAYASCGSQTEPEVAMKMLERQIVLQEDEDLASDAKHGTREALLAKRSLIVLDDVEDILPATNEAPSEDARALLASISALADVGQTRVLLVSRATIPDDLLSILHISPGNMDEKGLRELLTRRVLASNKAWGFDDGTLSKMSEPLKRLANQVGWNVRSLIWLAPLVAELAAVGQVLQVRDAVVELERRYPGDPGRSLLALARRYAERLDPSIRARLRRIGVFHKAAQVTVLAFVLEVETEECALLCRSLVSAGLAVANEHYLVPEPGFLVTMWLDMDAAERSAAEQRWFAGMTRFLELMSKHIHVDLTTVWKESHLIEPDCIAYCTSLKAQVEMQRITAEAALYNLTKVQLFAQILDMTAVMESIEVVHNVLKAHTKDAELAHMKVEYWQADAARAVGDTGKSLAQAERLIRRINAYGASSEARHLNARTHRLLGQALFQSGRALESLQSLQVAKQEIDADPELEWMQAGTLVDIGNALCHLGRVEEALKVYDEALTIAQSKGDTHSITAAVAQRSDALLLQGRLREALDGYKDILELSASLGWSANVATAWHQIGIIHRRLGEFDLAERAFREALAIKERLGTAGQGRTIVEIANLYSDQERHEDALALLDGASGHADFLDPFCRGTLRHNTGLALLQLGRLDEARAALLEAAEIKDGLDDAAEPWKPWWILSDLEQKAGCVDAALDARRKSFARYKAYRQRGGAPMSVTARFFARLGDTLEQDPRAAKAMLSQIRFTDDPTAQRQRRVIEALAEGSLDPNSINLEEDFEFEIIDAVEILLAAERSYKKP